MEEPEIDNHTKMLIGIRKSETPGNLETHPGGKKNETKLILICDTKNEIDDQFAIAYALKSEEINLLGVISTQNCQRHGKKSTELYHKEAQKIIKLAGAKIPALYGAKHQYSSKGPERSEGVEFIISTALKSKSKLTIVCTGPCTDIVNACLLEPKIKDRCEFIWLGGFRNDEEVKKSRGKEINFLGDKLAAELLFKLNLDLTLIPFWGVTDSLIMHGQLFSEALKKKETELTIYLSQLIDENWSRFRLKSLIPHHIKRFWVFADIAGIAIAKNLGVKKTLSIPACTITKGKFHFPENSKTKLKIIDSIDEHLILKEMKALILG